MDGFKVLLFMMFLFVLIRSINRIWRKCEKKKKTVSCRVLLERVEKLEKKLSIKSKGLSKGKAQKLPDVSSEMKAAAGF